MGPASRARCQLQIFRQLLFCRLTDIEQRQSAMQHGPLILLSPGRSGSTFAQRLINSVDGWYLFGEHQGAFRHFVEFQETLDYHAPSQKQYGDMIVERTEGFLGKWSAWASPFDGNDFNAVFAENLRELYTKRLPDHCVWGFKEIRYTARDAVAFSELFEEPCVIVLKRKFEDFCRSWCVVNLQGRKPNAYRARQLVLHYLGFYEQLRIASAVVRKQFLSVSYEEICANPQGLVDLVAGQFGWTLTAEDRKRVDQTSRQTVDYISEEAKRSGAHLFADFVKLAGELFLAASESSMADGAAAGSVPVQSIERSPSRFPADRKGRAALSLQPQSASSLEPSGGVRAPATAVEQSDSSSVAIDELSRSELPPLTSGEAAAAADANPLIAPIDAEIRDEIGKWGSHPFILVRLQQSSPQFLVCKTQDNNAEFVDALSRLPNLGTSSLLRGVERTLQGEIAAAADALSSWLQGAEPDFVERVYLGVPDDLTCPAYWGYPVFERAPLGPRGGAEERLRLLLRMFQAYDGSDGNNATRFALMEALAVTLGRELSARGEVIDAMRIVDRGLRHLPASMHLKAMRSALNIRRETAPDEQEFISFLIRRFDAAYYRELYKDAAEAGLDPLEHWLNCGIREERQISRNVTLRYGKLARKTSNHNWRHYRWRGEDIAARSTKPIPPEVTAQIFNQARHEPALLAAGAKTFANLARADRESDGHLDVAGVQRAIPREVEIVLMVPNLSTSEDNRLAADLVAALDKLGYGSILTIVTDQEAMEGSGEQTVAESFRATNIVFWENFWIRGPGPSKLAKLAQLISVLRPRLTLVADSRLGYEVVARFGRGLSENTKIYCVFTDVGSGHDFGARFSRRTLPFAVALTNDTVVATRLRERYGDLLGQRVLVVPARLAPVSEGIFATRLLARRQRIASAARPLTWAWMGHIKPSKAIGILSKLASSRPDDRFELFGQLEGPSAALGLAQRNVIFRDAPDNLATADFSEHDGFLLTGLAQGAPIVVAEMSQHAIPLVLPKEGGLSEIFDGGAVFLVEPASEDDMTTAYSLALDEVSGLTDSKTATMVKSARDQALQRHSPAAFLGAVTALFARP
jgi:glycosyltransferase involved in cell wall biosynthesis